MNPIPASSQECILQPEGNVKSINWLREIEHAYRQLLESDSEIFQIVEPILVNGKVVDFLYKRVNEACAYLLEKKRKDIEGKTAKEFWGLVEEDRIKLLEEVLKNGHSFCENSYSREANVYFNVHAWKLEHGQIAILFTNISNFKKISEALLKTKNQSEFEKQRLYTILETSPTAIIVVEAPDAQFSYLNKWALNLCGADYTGFELEAHLSKVKVLKFDGRAYGAEELPVSRALYKGEVIRNEEMLFYREDSISIPISVSAAPIYNTNGVITSAVTIFENISERRHTEDALRESEQKATLLVT